MTALDVLGFETLTLPGLTKLTLDKIPNQSCTFDVYSGTVIGKHTITTIMLTQVKQWMKENNIISRLAKQLSNHWSGKRFVYPLRLYILSMKKVFCA
jgi:hypothetical protein